MIYFLTSVSLLFGVMFHVMVKVMGYKKQFPTLSFGNIWGTFFKEEWDSLMVSAIIYGVTELSIFIINYQQINIPEWLQWGIFPLSLLMGYQGQRIAYKFLNTASDALEKKAETLGNITPNGKP